MVYSTCIISYILLQRSVKQLKRAWEKIKEVYKKTTVAVIKHRIGTGGGPSITDPPPNPILEEIAPHLVHFVDQRHDSDAVTGFFPHGTSAGSSADVDLPDVEFADEFQEVDIGNYLFIYSTRLISLIKLSSYSKLKKYGSLFSMDAQVGFVKNTARVNPSDYFHK